MNITTAQYEALLRYASVGAASLDDTAAFLVVRDAIDLANGVTRGVLCLRWQAVPNAPPPPGVTEYPPMQTHTLELMRAITRADVDEYLRNEVTLPDLVHVTPDPQGLVGWTLLDDYDF